MKGRVYILFLFVALGIFTLPFQRTAHAAATIKNLSKAESSLGLVANWTFDTNSTTITNSGHTGSVTDASGRGNTLTLGGGGWYEELSRVAGKIGQALTFDGDSNEATRNATVFNFQDNASFSIAAWVKTTYTSQEAILGTVAIGSTGGLAMTISGAVPGAVDLALIDSGVSNGRFGYSTALVADGAWHHVVATYDGSGGVSGMKMYIDGVQDTVNSALDTSPGTLTNTKLNIGNLQGGIAQFNGALDEVRMYSRAISAGEAQQLFQNSQSKINRSLTNTVSNLGLLAYWPFDGGFLHWSSATAGTVTDASGNGRDGTLTNMNQKTASMIGKIGQALSFNGTSYVDVSGTSGVANNLSDFTVATWFKTTVAHSGHGGIMVSKVNSGGMASGTGWWLDLGGPSGAGANVVDAAIETNGSTWRGKFTSGTYNDGQWHHAVMVVTGGNTVTLYVDNVVATNNSSGGTIGSYSNAANIRLGNDQDGELFNGLLDDTRIYGRALSASEVTALYAFGKAALQKTQTSLIPNGLIGYWPFDGKYLTWSSKTAGTAGDASGGGHPGTLTSMNQATAAVLGKVGQALSFNGMSYVDVSGTSGVANNLANFTASVWFKTTQSQSGATGYGGAMVAKLTSGGTPSGTGWGLNVSGPGRGIGANHIDATIQTNGSQWRAKYSTATVNDGQWHHAVMVVAGGNTVTLYVDGSTSGTASDNGGPPPMGPSYSNSSTIRIGNNDADELFRGTIDEVRIYNRALTAAEVWQLYKAGSGGGGVIDSPPSPPAFTCGTSTVSDVDGNVYDTLLIGAQCWMKQNMRVGTRINASTSQTNNGVIEKYCYSNSNTNCTANNPNQPDGGLYRWGEAMQYSTTPGAQGICPVDWHIPTHDEFTTLERAVCTSGTCATDFPFDTTTQSVRGTNEGTKLKAGGSSGWEGNLAGYVNPAGSAFSSRTADGYWWASSHNAGIPPWDPWYRNLEGSFNGIDRETDGDDDAISVRCLKN